MKSIDDTENGDESAENFTSGSKSVKSVDPDTTGRNSNCPESGPSSYERRGFIRKAAIVTAVAGVGGSILGGRTMLSASSAKSTCCLCYFPVTTPAHCGKSEDVCGALAVWSGCSIISSTPPGTGATLSGSSTCDVLSITNSCTGAAIVGSAPSGTGIRGSGTIGVEGVSSSPTSIPMIAKGASGQTANLQEWQKSCGTIYAVISSAGSLGLGGVTKPNHVLCVSGKAHASAAFGIATSCINTTLAVHGSVSTKARAVTSATTMATTDFAILANASSAAFTVTLPAADTPGVCNGMIVFVKKTDSSVNAVAVAAASGDTIEGAPSMSLTKQYDALQLISNGVHEWFLLGNSVGDAFVS